MKGILFFVLALTGTCFASEEETTFTGSTPANTTVRAFLGISLTDSVDFIRWKITINAGTYHLQSNYGIGKPNTNGFIDGGKKIELRGAVSKEENYYRFVNGNKTLTAVELNTNLVHFLHTDKSTMMGNGGWSYTLNRIAPVATDEINFSSRQTALSDSLELVGRTPCNVSGAETGKSCYKLKWRIVLYANSKSNTPTRYKIFGTAFRGSGAKTGNWKITRQDTRVVYQLDDAAGNALLYLLRVDDNIVLFTDADGKLPVGNEDFSYTLSRGN